MEQLSSTQSSDSNYLVSEDIGTAFFLNTTVKTTTNDKSSFKIYELPSKVCILSIFKWTKMVTNNIKMCLKCLKIYKIHITEVTCFNFIRSQRYRRQRLDRQKISIDTLDKSIQEYTNKNNLLTVSCQVVSKLIKTLVVKFLFKFY